MLASNPIIDRLREGSNEEAEKTNPLYIPIFIKQIILNSFYINPDPNINPRSQLKKANGEALDISFFKSLFIAYFKIKDVSIEWLNAANSPTYILMSPELGNCVARVTAMPAFAISANDKIYKSQTKKDKLKVPYSIFQQLSLDDKQRNFLRDSGLYSFSTNTNEPLCFSVVTYLPELRQETGEVIAGSLDSYYKTNSTEVFTAERTRTALIDTVHLAKGLLKHLNQNIFWLDLKISNIYRDQEANLIIQDPKAHIDGNKLKNIFDSKTKSLTQINNIVHDRMTEAYKPEGIKDADVYSLEKLYCYQLSIILFELISGEVGNPACTVKEKLLASPLHDTRLGQLILKGLNEELTSLGKFIKEIKDPSKFVLEAQQVQRVEVVSAPSSPQVRTRAQTWNASVASSPNLPRFGIALHGLARGDGPEIQRTRDGRFQPVFLPAVSSSPDSSTHSTGNGNNRVFSEGESSDKIDSGDSGDSLPSELTASGSLSSASPRSSGPSK